MISKYNLLKISLIGFLICFSLIYIIEINYNPKIIQIDDIENNTKISEIIKIKAKIIKLNLRKETLFLTLKDESNTSINAIVFNYNKTSKRNINLTKNKYYYFIGKISLYKQKKEIIIKKISKIKKY